MHFSKEIINDHLDPNRVKPEQEDIIDVLLQIKKEKTFTYDLSMDNIKAVLMDMFVAGTDTSAAMVVWAMTELIKNPTAMKKVQKEIRDSPARHKGYVSVEDLPELEYLKAVVKETFRIQPAAPLLVLRESLQKCTIEGYDIIPKTLVFVNVWAIGRDPEYWKDPEIFMPERFLGSSIDYKGNDFMLIPFGAGRRMCPGILLGVANFELALANLLYSFDWGLPDDMKSEDIDTDTLPGLPIIGNLHQFDPSKPHIYFAKLAKIYGPILTTRFGTTPAVVVQSAKTAKEVLHTQDLNFCYRPSMIATQRLSYKGLDLAFAQSYGYFREIKKICVVHLLSSKRVESFTPIRQEEVLRMVNKISTQISSGLETVNLSELLMSFASSNICRIAFGKRYDEDEGSNRSRFHNLLNDAQAMFTAFFFTDYFPSIGWLDKLTGQSSRLEKTFTELDVFYDEIINDHLDPNRPVSETEDIIIIIYAEF
uniref:Cytochrome P450 n=1 Tax=Chenopodium quinoa TaxID=63459 RepID=A0A803ND80_CHEQI